MGCEYENKSKVCVGCAYEEIQSECIKELMNGEYISGIDVAINDMVSELTKITNHGNYTAEYLTGLYKRVGARVKDARTQGCAGRV